MKKSFMTRALAMGLSLAMAFSLSAATNVSVASAAAKPAMKSKTMTVKVGQSKNYKATTATQKAYKITKVRLSKAGQENADVTISSTGKSIKVTGKSATKSRNLVIRFQNRKTKKSQNITTKVVVKANEEEALKLATVKQTASNAVTVTFNKDASKDVTKDNLTIKSVDGSVELSIKNVAFLADGKEAAVTVFGNFTNGTQYNVNYNSVDVPFTASVGAVASVTVHTAQAQQNVTTPIEFLLYDASGIDVTPSISVDTNVYVSVTGTYSSVDVARASAAKITMVNIGDTAEVTVTYSSNEKDAVDVVGKQTITCVDAKAAQGTKLFAVTSDPEKINNESLCAKFYLGLGDTNAKIAVNATNDIYFCAKDDKGDVIKYDSYDVESSNDNIVNAVVANNNGKFARISATGNTIGSAQLNVTAYNNGKATYYTIPVQTYKADVPVRMSLTIDKPTMSDADDNDYKATVTAQLLDKDGKAVKADFKATIVDQAKLTTPALITAPTINGTTKAEFEVTAKKAEARTYTIEVTGADNNNYTTPFTRRVTLTVKALPDELKNITYNIELNRSNVDVTDKEVAKRSVTAKLYAMCNGLFAGYVDMGNMRQSKIAGKPVAAGEALKVVTMSAIFGTQTFGEKETLVATSDAVTVVSNAATTSAASITFSTVSGGGAGKTIDTATDVAKYGNYTIKFQFLKDKTGATSESRTTNVKVDHSYPMPTVKVLSTKVDVLSDTQIIADGHLTTNVDMNNDTSEHQSILGFYKDGTNGTKQPVTSGSNQRMIVKYAQVKDNISTGETWLFYVPINTTFTQR